MEVMAMEMENKDQRGFKPILRDFQFCKIEL